MAKKRVTNEDIKMAAEPMDEVLPDNDSTEFLNSGSTLINLLLSDRHDGGYQKGNYFLFWGTSRSGKSLLTLQGLAEAANDPKFDGYELIEDDSERGAGAGLRGLFGNKAAERIKPPFYQENGAWGASLQVEDFFFNLDDKLKAGTPFVYCIDSFDSLSSEDEGKKFEETKKALRAGKEATGSYGDGKAKKYSSYLRRVVAPIRSSNSILFGISQAKDNIGFGFEKHSRSGGHSLRYYATCEVMVDIVEGIKKTVAGNPRHIGNRVKVTAHKNRQTGGRGSVLISIFDSHGVDDLGDIVYYLSETENHWKKSGQRLIAPEFDFEGTAEKLITTIEETGQEEKLRQLCQTVWLEIKEKSALNRKKRYE